ncbi:Metallo-dependent phosphatase [Thozetella sp. PMI_491]|nr:Metallo-dependent phosphatase [Thozetella sp. PMI_491]
MPTRTRRTRIVCISDTHNGSVKLPQGDVLIHAGDLTNQGSYSELSKAVQWLQKARFEVKIVVAGNHDITLDRNFYADHGQYFHNSNPQDPDRCIDLLKETPGLMYLCHEPAAIRLTDPNGPKTFFTVFGSPFSPREGMWAFGYGGDDEGSTRDNQLKLGSTASELWSQIPLNTDILVTHTPPYRHCDESASRRRAAGCEVLRQTLWRVRPRLHVCGHVHEARGAERVRWDIDGAPGAANVAYAEAQVECWQDPNPDPNSAKISLVDLTARNENLALDNHGPMCRRETCIVNCAVVATSWPHTGGKRFNKPIVVDLDLPIWS